MTDEVKPESLIERTRREASERIAQIDEEVSLLDSDIRLRQSQRRELVVEREDLQRLLGGTVKRTVNRRPKGERAPAPEAVADALDHAAQAVTEMAKPKASKPKRVRGTKPGAEVVDANPGQFLRDVQAQRNGEESEVTDG